jgi:hypothetical protein
MKPEEVRKLWENLLRAPQPQDFVTLLLQELPFPPLQIAPGIAGQSA